MFDKNLLLSLLKVSLNPFQLFSILLPVKLFLKHQFPVFNVDTLFNFLTFVPRGYGAIYSKATKKKRLKKSNREQTSKNLIKCLCRVCFSVFVFVQYWSIKRLLPHLAVCYWHFSDFFRDPFVSINFCIRGRIETFMTGTQLREKLKAKSISISIAMAFTCKLRAEMGRQTMLFPFSTHSKSNEEMDHKSADVYIIPLHSPYTKNLFTSKQTMENAVQ